MVAGLALAPALSVPANVSVKAGAPLGIVRGVVRDGAGNPIADARVAFFRVGTSKLLKQVRSAADGRFLAKVLPGSYTVLAVAQGFNPATLNEVQVGQSSVLEYGFKLERAGSGNTLPEKRLDRNNPKWIVRSAILGRSIYQNREGNVPIAEETVTIPNREENRVNDKIQSVASTYFSASDKGNFLGFNFAALIPIKDDAQVVLAAQTGTGLNAPQRFDSELRFKPVEDHNIRIRTSAAKIGTIEQGEKDRTLGQISVQATDEWQVRNGVILVFGFDLARFVGAGDDFAMSPRIGFQYDLDARTRFRTAYTSNSEPRTWSRAIELEGTQIAFREPISIDDVVIENGTPKLNRSSRLEFGIERVLDGRSSVEATAFLDTIFGRGVGVKLVPFDNADGEFDSFTGEQQGTARGVRVVYSRRIGDRVTAGAGYSIGRGQRLSSESVSSPERLFENDVFRTFFGQIEADLRTGTTIRTVYRLSPDATIYAIDPFQGRLAIYDPGLSILLTQSLPNLGLPFQAQAIVDARNVLDHRTGIVGEEGSLMLNSGGRAIRGGILVRF